jgi:hypothetical protein
VQLFSSGKHHSLTRDPFPYRTVTGTRGGRRLPGYTLIFEPRPQFDEVPLTNGINLFVAEFRDSVKTAPTPRDEVRGWIEYLEAVMAHPKTKPHDSREHALRVIKRYASLIEEKDQTEQTIAAIHRAAGTSL